MKDRVLHVRVNNDVKLEAEEILNSLGINMSVAVNMFLKRVCIEKGLPFKLGYDDYNDETKKAIKESFYIAEKGVGYNSVEEMFMDLDK